VGHYEQKIERKEIKQEEIEQEKKTPKNFEKVDHAI
jgi:hypothetical protein